ncbi:MAG: hypothetical protein ACTHJT_16470 [Cytophaga sp.]|uniref:hypothetical protein n=1 Tax=Cytophaga sp. TaxID=29535 RepID=UPI003F7FED1C
MKISFIVTVLYLLIAGNTTYFLGKSLYKHGENFLMSIFRNRIEIVLPVNKILLTGFYLVNAGFVLPFLEQNKGLTTMADCVEFLAFKIGFIYLVLGGMHFTNILIFVLIEKKSNPSTSN